MITGFEWTGVQLTDAEKDLYLFGAIPTPPEWRVETNPEENHYHDPDHNDDFLDQMISETVAEMQPAFQVTPGKEGMVFDLGAGG